MRHNCWKPKRSINPGGDFWHVHGHFLQKKFRHGRARKKKTAREHTRSPSGAMAAQDFVFEPAMSDFFGKKAHVKAQMTFKKLNLKSHRLSISIVKLLNHQ